MANTHQTIEKGPQAHSRTIKFNKEAIKNLRNVLEPLEKPIGTSACTPTFTSIFSSSHALNASNNPSKCIDS